MMSIREAIPEDLPRLSALFDAYRQFYGHPSDRDAARDFLQARMGAGDSVIYVADSGGDLGGFVQLYPLWSSTRLRRLWLLNDLFVDVSCRGRGISKQLMERCKRLALETDACGLHLETQPHNHIANRLYRQSGFRLEEENFYFWQAEKAAGS